MLLIYPPVAKPSEAPAGIAKLSAALNRRGIPCEVLDANIEGLLHLLEQPRPIPSDTWSLRAVRNRQRNIDGLRRIETYKSVDRYRRAVRDLQRVLALSGGDTGAVPGLADYQHHRFSPLRSADLFSAAEHPEQNPFYPYFRERLTEVIERESPAMVGFSLTYLSQALCTFAMIGHIRKRFPGLKMVLGGGLVTSWGSRQGGKNPFAGLVDHLVSGPGEEALLSLLGCADRTAGHPVPDYRGFPLQDYLSPDVIMPYSAASGCYWRKCSFCPEAAEDNPFVPVPPKQAVADLSVLNGRHQPVLIHLLDNAVSPALMKTLIEDPPGVPWYGFARIGPELADRDFCLALVRSGCVMLQLGLESGDEGVLDGLHKGTDIRTASRALENLEQAGIKTYVYLLFGTPAEAEREARATLDFVVRHAASIDFLNLAIFNMPLCGQEGKELGTDGFSQGDLSLYTDFRHPRGWDRRRVRQFLDREFKRHPAVAAILRNDPPVFTSSHAAVFAVLSRDKPLDGNRNRR
jgi:radical SAM superfamily enzyme YgiQ (UPF0313 family)